MNAVGIDVSKGKSTVCVMRPFGEIVASPFEVLHTADELGKLANLLKNLNGETKVIMECTGNYHLPIANALRSAKLTICAVHAQLIYDFGNNSIRKVKTDNADSIKIANYGLANWLDLSEYIPEDDIRQMLKTYSRQYNKYNKIKIMLKNNLISLLDRTFPGINESFTSPPRKTDGHEKWIDFAAYFWHCECVSKLSLNAFTEKYRKWCKREGYNFSSSKAESIHSLSRSLVNVIPKNETTRLLITQAILQLNHIAETLAVVAKEMIQLATSLPEFPVATGFFGVGEILGSQIIAEIGNVRRFQRKQSLVCFAGLEPEGEQSGKRKKDGEISKKGSPHLRKALFQVMSCVLQQSPSDDVVYQFLDRKRANGKHYYNYMSAGAAKFLRIYYARVTEYLQSLENVA